MREENRSEIIHDALNLLDDEMIEEVDKLRGGVVSDVAPVVLEENETQENDVQRELRPWRKWAALAASVCVLIMIGGIWTASIEKGSAGLGNGDVAMEDVQEDKNVSQNEIGAPTGTSDDVAINESEEIEYGWSGSVIGGKNYDVETTEAAITDFAVRLFQENIERDDKKQENVLISPVSILSALGMTSFGAQEETLSQMETVFGVSRGNLNRYINEEFNNLSEELCLANSIWFKEDEKLTVKSEFLQFNQEFFEADVYEAAFDDTTLKEINAWIEDETDGTIKNILDKIPEDVVMYLVNALVFEAEWQESYTERQIHEGTFTTQAGQAQKVKMMHGSESLYLEDENATGFIKYYKDGKYAFVALLPNEDTDVYDYVKNITGAHLSEMLSSPSKVKVYTQIPQFSYEYKVEIQDVLKDMGMTDLFDTHQANLEGLGVYEGGNLYVSRVLHKTFIEVSPVGTKAGAATVVEVPTYGAAIEPEDVKEVYLDRPFMYMIIDCENNQPIFMGTVNSIE